MVISRTKPLTLKIYTPDIKRITLYFYGILFSIKKIGKKIDLNLHYSFILNFKIPKRVRTYVYKKRLVIVGAERTIKNLVKGLTNLRTPNSYTGTGLRQRKNKYKTKPGKIRKR